MADTHTKRKWMTKLWLVLMTKTLTHFTFINIKYTHWQISNVCLYLYLSMTGLDPKICHKLCKLLSLRPFNSSGIQQLPYDWCPNGKVHFWWSTGIVTTWIFSFINQKLPSAISNVITSIYCSLKTISSGASRV